MRGETGKNTLKGGGKEKKGEETKVLKRGQTGSKGGCLKKRGWNPLTNYGYLVKGIGEQPVSNGGSSLSAHVNILTSTIALHFPVPLTLIFSEEKGDPPS